MVFWAIVLIILLSMAQPLPSITRAVWIVFMVIMAMVIALDKKSIKNVTEVVGSMMQIAFAPLVFLTILSARLVKGYYRK